MKYVLDTDMLIYFLNGKESVVRCFAEVSQEKLHTTIISYAELLFGAYNSEHKKRNLEQVEGLLKQLPLLPFCEQASHIFGEYKAYLQSEGSIIADLDLMIASIAVKNHMTLVTNNTRHFGRIKRLELDNWLNT